MHHTTIYTFYRNADYLFIAVYNTVFSHILLPIKELHQKKRKMHSAAHVHTFIYTHINFTLHHWQGIMSP